MTDEAAVVPYAPPTITGQALGPLDDKEFSLMWRMSEALAASGAFKDARDAAKCFVKVLAGRELGLGPFQAMSSLYVFDGKVEMSAQLQAVMVKRAGYDYIVSDHTDAGCTVTILDPAGKVLGATTFDTAKATQAGLLGKDNWKKYPANMMFARAMSNAVAFFCPEVTGGVRVYAPGEIDRSDAVVALPPGAAGQQAEEGGAQEAAPEAEEQPKRKRRTKAEMEAARAEAAAAAADADAEGTAQEDPPPAADPPQPQADPPAEDEGKGETISVAQRRKLFATQRENGVDDETLKAVLTQITGGPHTDRIRAAQFDMILAAVADPAAFFDTLRETAEAEAAAAAEADA